MTAQPSGTLFRALQAQALGYEGVLMQRGTREFRVFSDGGEQRPTMRWREAGGSWLCTECLSASQSCGCTGVSTALVSADGEYVAVFSRDSWRARDWSLRIMDLAQRSAAAVSGGIGKPAMAWSAQMLHVVQELDGATQVVSYAPDGSVERSVPLPALTTASLESLCAAQDGTVVVTRRLPDDSVALQLVDLDGSVRSQVASGATFATVQAGELVWLSQVDGCPTVFWSAGGLVSWSEPGWRGREATGLWAVGDGLLVRLTVDGGDSLSVVRGRGPTARAEPLRLPWEIQSVKGVDVDPHADHNVTFQATPVLPPASTLLADLDTGRVAFEKVPATSFVTRRGTGPSANVIVSGLEGGTRSAVLMVPFGGLGPTEPAMPTACRLWVASGRTYSVCGTKLMGAAKQINSEEVIQLMADASRELAADTGVAVRDLTLWGAGSGGLLAILAWALYPESFGKVVATNLDAEILLSHLQQWDRGPAIDRPDLLLSLAGQATTADACVREFQQDFHYEPAVVPPPRDQSFRESARHVADILTWMDPSLCSDIA